MNQTRLSAAALCVGFAQACLDFALVKYFAGKLEIKASNYAKRYVPVYHPTWISYSALKNILKQDYGHDIHVGAIEKEPSRKQFIEKKGLGFNKDVIDIFINHIQDAIDVIPQ